MKHLAPNASHLRTDVGDYMRSLIERARLSQEEVAGVLGIAPRTFRRYLSGAVAAPYVVQFAVEAHCFAVAEATESVGALATESGASLARMANRLRREIEAQPTAAHARQRAKRQLRRVEGVLSKRA